MDPILGCQSELGEDSAWQIDTEHRQSGLGSGGEFANCQR